MRNVFRELGRYFWIPSTYVFDVYNVRKSPNYKTYFHVQVEVGFWKFEYFQFYFILTIRLNPAFFCPNCFQNIKYYFKNMRNVFWELGRYFWIPSTYVFEVYNVRKSQIIRKFFHVQMEVGFWKFDFFFQFHLILTARLNVTFLCPNCVQNIKYHSNNMRDVFY